MSELEGFSKGEEMIRFYFWSRIWELFELNVWGRIGFFGIK